MMISTITATHDNDRRSPMNILRDRIFGAVIVLATTVLCVSTLAAMGLAVGQIA